MAILLANVHHDILLQREVSQRLPVNSQPSEAQNVPEMGEAMRSQVPDGNVA